MNTLLHELLVLKWLAQWCMGYPLEDIQKIEIRTFLLSAAISAIITLVAIWIGYTAVNWYLG